MKMKALLLALLLISDCATTIAGPAYGPCYAACMAWCAGASAATGPVALPFTVSCAAYCAVICAPAFCFADGQMVTRLDAAGTTHHVPVQWLRPGEEVLTVIDGTCHSTQVVQNIRLVGNFSFVGVESVSEDCTYHLEVTTDHVVTRFTKNDSAQSLSTQQMQAVLASGLQVGDEILVVASNFVATRALITKIQPLFLPAKNTLMTASGTVVASGVYVTTMCGVGSDYIDQPNLESALTKWQAEHTGHFATHFAA